MDRTSQRASSISINKEEFKKVGYQMVDAISEFIDTIDDRPVTSGESPNQIQKILGTNSLPEQGTSVEDLMQRTVDLLFDYSLLNGHPKFFGYITSSAAPIGALADLLAAAVNPNVGANILSPVATAIWSFTDLWRNTGERWEYGKPYCISCGENSKSAKAVEGGWSEEPPC